MTLHRRLPAGIAALRLVCASLLSSWRFLATALALGGLALAGSCSSPDPGNPVAATGGPQANQAKPAITPVTKIVLPTVEGSAPAPTSAFANYFGTVTVDGSPARDGLAVEIFTPGGVLVGRSATKQGWYPYTRAFGADRQSSPSVPGALAGDALIFKVDGKSATTSISPVGWKNEPAPARVDLTVNGG